MKATLYSADFVKTSDNGIRLLELNTDTSFLNTQVNTFDFREIHNILSSSNLDEVHVIYKGYQKYFVDVFSQSLHDSSSITTFNSTLENEHTIYPTDVADSDTKFILRCAYNESAIFDSEYCKESIGLYKLMVDGTTDYTQSVVEFYYSSSEDDQAFDYLNRGHINSNSVIPDYVTKNTLESEEGARLKFYKLNSVSSGSYSDKTNDFINEIKSEGKLILPYYDTTEGGDYVKSIRSVNILYGPSLENLNIYTGETSASFDIPTTESFQAPTGSELYKAYPQKHYYEFATNYIKFDWRNQGGISPSENLQSGSELVSIDGAIVGNSYTSIRIPSLPDTDNIYELMSWSLDGNTLPAETATTSSVLISKTTHENYWGVFTEVVFGTGSLLTGPSLPMLVYDASTNKTRYEYVYNLDTTNHSIYKLDGTLQSIDELNFFVTSEPSSSTVELNFESDDTFIINETGVKLVSHNIYYGPGAGFYGSCFIAGTKITLSSGETKNIEDIVVGDEVVSYNEQTGFQENKSVTKLTQPIHDDLVKYTFSNGTEIICTYDHPFYVNDMELASYKPDLTNERYELSGVSVIKENDFVFTLSGDVDVTIQSIEELPRVDTQTYIFSVEDNKNFYANEILTHNKV